MRRTVWIASTLMTVLSAPAAQAGDMASLNVLGYSRDGNVFAFEEFGVLDGSGGAYSNIYFIDIAKDAFLPGTPIREGGPEQEGQLASVRSTSHGRADALMEKFGMADDPGIVVAYNPPSEVDGDPNKVRYYPYLSAQISGHTYTIELDEREFPPTAECLNMTGTYTGFTLRLTENQGVATNVVLHADDTVPKSRNCPNQYRIGAVVASEIRDVPQMAMVLVGSFGFEGNDQRWIAVPVRPVGQ